MIVELKPSPKPMKRYRVIMDTGKSYDFGLKGGETYIDHKDKKKRNAYWARHCGNDTERRLIDNLVPSPSLFAARLLWGDYTDIEKNISQLNQEWAKPRRRR
jgi:hypothetical protein